MSSRSLDDLHPRLQKLAKEFIEKCREEGIDILIYCTYRSKEEQDNLYALGRTKPGAIVTYKKGGESLHNFELNGKPASLAFDFVPLLNGKAAWGAEKLFVKAATIAKSLGLKWGGDWARFKDYPHLYLDKEDVL